jgi:hypothetical protein
MRLCILAALAAGALSDVPEQGQADLDNVRITSPLRVGQIFIAGNFVTSNEFLLDRFPLFPGQRLSGKDLSAARQSLAPLILLGVYCTVSVTDDPAQPDSEYKDILITVRESQGAPLLLTAYDAARFRLGIAGPRALD